MRSYAALAKCTVVLATACVLFSGCTDKKRIAELEQTNQALESRVAKLDNDLTLEKNAARARQAEIANLQTQIADSQAKIAEAQKAAEQKKPAVAAKKATTPAKKTTSTAKKSTSSKVHK